MHIHFILCFLCCLHGSSTLSAQTLQRRAFLGIQMEPVTDDVQRVMKLPAVKGVLIQRVLPGSTAEYAGLRSGDVLLEFNNQEVNSPTEGVRIVGNCKEGQVVQYKYIRDGKISLAETTIQGLPRESYPDLLVSYDAIQTDGALLRTISTRPKSESGKLPAMLFIQGVGCYSVDAPFDTLAPETQLINTIARQGFVVMRVDKSGMGDSQGPPCSSIDFNTELAGYVSAFSALQTRSDVDASRCFIFGHSIGGVMAPLVARELSVKGIIVYGTLGVNFMEYFAMTRRNISEAYSMSATESDDYIKEQCACASMLLNARLSREEAVIRIPGCGNVYDFLLSRTAQFWYQLHDLNIPGLWQEYEGALLSLRGSTDFVTTKMEHEHIVSVLNQQHPGKGTFVELKDCNHGMHTAATYHEAINNPGPFNTNVSDVVMDWLEQQFSDKATVKPTGKREVVTQVVWMDGVENAYPRISGDGTNILFQSNRGGKWHIYLMGVDGSNVLQLTHGDHNNNFPDWLTDNRMIAFVSDRDGNEEIYVMQMDGNNLSRLTNHPARDIHPYFAPDGKRILFNSSRDEANSFEIYQINTKGTDLIRLTNTIEVETCARFSPDQQKILYLKGFSDGSDDIFVMQADGSNPVNLTSTPQMEGWPAWSPDGDKIIFSSRRNGHYCLYEMQPDGSDVRQVSFAEAPRYDARAGYAASGNQIIFNRQTGNTIGIFLLQLQNS